MTTILHIASSSAYHENSYSRQVGKLTVEGLVKNHPGANVIERDLVKSTVPHISREWVTAAFSGKDSKELKLSQTLIDEVLGSDMLVIEAPMYNFSIPSVLKAWIDHVVRAGKTFQYGGNGPQGLVTGKKVYLILSRGGIYSEGPSKAMDYQETYLRATLGFIGLTDVESIYIEGVALGPDKIAEAVAAATTRAQALTSAA